MLILSIRTDNPKAEVGLFDSKRRLAYETWQADRQLSTSLHVKIESLGRTHHKVLPDLQGIVVFKGPGSFTGLRIGISVANALAYALHIPVVGTTGQKWLDDGIARLAEGKNEAIVLPEYGTPVHVTKPKH